jgi:hypothetical protein
MKENLPKIMGQISRAKENIEELYSLEINTKLALREVLGTMENCFLIIKRGFNK